MALINKMSIDEMIALRGMKREDALAVIETFDLTPEERDQARKLVPEVEPPRFDPRFDNRLWAATAYLLGASLRQIAVEKGVSRQSVFEQVMRVIPEDRASKRIGNFLTLEAMGEYKVAFFENIDFLRTKGALECAVWLVASVDLDV